MGAPELPADVRPFVDVAISGARKQLERGAELTAMAFIHAPSTRTGFLAMPMPTGPGGKDAWAHMIRTLSSAADARFVMLVSETWTHDVKDHAEMDRLMAEFKEVRFIPGRREGMLVQVETAEGLWQGTAEVVPLAASTSGGRTFGALKFEWMREAEGRFIGLMGARDGRRN